MTKPQIPDNIETDWEDGYYGVSKRLPDQEIIDDLVNKFNQLLEYLRSLADE